MQEKNYPQNSFTFPIVNLYLNILGMSKYDGRWRTDDFDFMASISDISFTKLLKINPKDNLICHLMMEEQQS